MFENSEKLNNQAVRLASKGEYDDAIACLKRAITMENSNHLLWFNLALTYRDAGNLKQAKNAMECALKIKPNDEDTIECLATFCVSLRSFDEGFYYCTEGIDINPFNPHFWNIAGVIKFNTSQYAEAANFFEHAVSLSPHYYDALYNLRDTYSELKNTTGVQECNRAMSSLQQDS